MNLVDLYESARALGWSLIHFLWQGTLIAIALELGLVGLRKSSAELRYLVRCAALVLMGAAPAVTFWFMRAQAVPASEGAVAAQGLGVWSGELWLVAVSGAWFIGAGLFGARLFRDYLRIRRLHGAAAGTALPSAWQARFDRLATALGTRALARVVDSAALSAPTVIGFIKPVVLIPARVLSGLTQDQIEALMAHELAHVMRHDFIVNLLQSALEALLFYHPAVWWVSKGIRAEREYCCDDVALRVTTDRVSYARALTTLESWRGRELQVGMSTLGGSLMHRIQRLLGHQAGAPARRPLSILGALLAVSLLGATTLSHAASAQDPDRLREMRAHLDGMQSRIDQLRELLDRAEALHHSGNRGYDSRSRGRETDAETERRDLLEETFDPRTHADTFHEHPLKALEGIYGQHGQRERMDAKQVHEHVQDAFEENRIHALNVDGFGRLELRGLPDADKIHAKIKKALEKAKLLSLDVDGLGRVELQGIPDADAIHAQVKKALERARVHSLEVDGFGRIELLVYPDADKIHAKVKKALEKAGLGKDGHNDPLLKLDHPKHLEGLHEHLQGHDLLRLRSLDESKELQLRLRDLEKLHGHEEAEGKTSTGTVF